MIADWLVFALALAALWLLWLWLGFLFDAIDDYWHAERDLTLEDAQATEGTGSSAEC